MEKFINVFDNSEWEEAPGYPSGTKRRVLFNNLGVKTMLLKYPKGFYMDLHSHIYTEQHLVLEGEYSSEGEVFKKGTYRSIDAHVNHGPFQSEKGALVLVVWTPNKQKE